MGLSTVYWWISRFIYLVNCRHAVESNDMDGWMNAASESEIEAKCCPVCRTPVSLRGLRRYSKVIIAANLEVGRVKKIMFGKNKSIKSLLESIALDVEQKLGNFGETSKISAFGWDLLHQCTQPLLCEALPPQKVSSQNIPHFQSVRIYRFLRYF